MKRSMKLLIGAGVLALLGVMAYQALHANRRSKVDVRAEVVGRRDLVARVTASGHIEAKRSVDISADISGRIVELPVEEGDLVEEDDLLLVIDPTQYRAAVRRAEAQLAEARSREARALADYRQYRRDWERIRQLKERTPELVTDQEAEQTRTQMEAQRAELDAARHAVAQSEAALEEARDRLEKTVIRAPMSGRITRLNVERGETAVVGTMNNPGSLLLTVSDLSVMEAVVEMDETDVPLVEVGDSASVEIDAFPDRSFAGRVTKIGHSSVRPRDSRTATGADEAVDFEVRITLSDPPAGIRPDLSATADVITDTRDDVLAIPIISLTLHSPGAEDEAGGADGEVNAGGEREEMEGVFIVDRGVAEFRPVEVGIAGDNYFEVLDGLAVGDTVVSGSYQAIRDLEAGTGLKLTRVTKPSATRTETRAAAAETPSEDAGRATPDQEPASSTTGEPPTPRGGS